MAPKIGGLDNLKNKLARTQGALKKLDQALLKAGLVVAGQAQKNARKGRPHLRVQTGRLWQGIHAKRAGKGRVQVGPNVIYGRIHEFGGKAGRGHRVNIPARPYLYPALDEKRQDAIDIIRSVYRGPLKLGGRSV